MKKLRFVPPLLFIAVITVSGCSTSGPTTPADYMRGHASDQLADVNQQKQFADDWEAGRKLVSQGNQDVKQGTDKVRKGEESIKDGNAQIAQGENRIEQGKEKMRIAKEGFQQSNPGVNLQTSR